jgi:hypothetical protein
VFSKVETRKGVAEGRAYFLSLLLYFMIRIHSLHPVVCLKTALPNGKPSSSVNTTVILQSNSKDKTAYFGVTFRSRNIKTSFSVVFNDVVNYRVYIVGDTNMGHWWNDTVRSQITNLILRGGGGGGRHRTALTTFVPVRMSVCSHWRRTILV